MLLRTLIHRIIRYCGIAILIRKIFARNNITIVVYHKPEEKFFKMHINYLSGLYNFISLSDLIDALYSDKPQALPKYAMLITLDDGWKENFNLLDTIKEYKIRPLIFLSSHLINTNRNFWFTVCNYDEIEKLKKKSSSQRSEKLIKDYDFYYEKEFSDNRQALSLDEIQKMKEMVDFGTHSSFHTILTKCNSREKEFEINGSIERVEELLGIPVTAFAYPNGDYDEETIKMLKPGNIKVARSMDAGWNNRNTDPYRLKAIALSDNADINKLAVELTGISMYMQYLFKGRINGQKPVN
jgi:peptidoglycan/xylan/chitin deacetylase (PgdA/CDA1 family)